MRGDFAVDTSHGTESQDCSARDLDHSGAVPESAKAIIHTNSDIRLTEGKLNICAWIDLPKLSHSSPGGLPIHIEQAVRLQGLHDFTANLCRESQDRVQILIIPTYK